MFLVRICTLVIHFNQNVNNRRLYFVTTFIHLLLTYTIIVLSVVNYTIVYLRYLPNSTTLIILYISLQKDKKSDRSS